MVTSVVMWSLASLPLALPQRRKLRKIRGDSQPIPENPHRGNIMQKKLAAEFFGTFWLVLGGCGAAVFAAGFPTLGIGFAGVALAFGLTVLTMAYAVGHISGGHFNPAV